MLGVESPYVDVECMLMAVTIVEALGIKNIKLHINSLGDDESRTAYREALKNHSDQCLMIYVKTVRHVLKRTH